MMKMENEMNVNVPLEIIKASEIEPKEVKWLWYPYIPFGKVTLLQGDPGDGKSKLMLSIAALLSKGEPLPFTEEETEPMTVIYQTTEDDADDTVVPRFNSAGGNGENLIFIKEDEKSLSFGDKELQIGFLIITHDLDTAMYMEGAIHVMRRGKIIETVEQPHHFSDFQEPYSQMLVKAVRSKRLALQ